MIHLLIRFFAMLTSDITPTLGNDKRTRNGFKRAGDIAIPCASGTCSYAAPNAKSGAGKLLLQPRICCG